MAESSTARISGERAAGLTVCRFGGDAVEYGELTDCLGASCELKSSCENVTGEGACLNCSVWAGDDPRKTVIFFPLLARSSSSSRSTSSLLARSFANCNSMSFTLLSSCCLTASSASTSKRLRSLDDWAARRLRRTRSTRRCSFSSSVFARFLGGRLVLGSGNC